jgi:hypothetical protein
LDVARKGGIKVRRLVAATSDAYRAQLLGLHPFQWCKLSAIALISSSSKHKRFNGGKINF